MYFVYVNGEFIKAFDEFYDEDKIFIHFKHTYPQDSIEILTG